ncbi:MAG TPA: hypothetical protein VEH48_02335 [Candidatus Nitrosopolaris sp.]|nr:hypothetical protein [Candidatus Nitrosopolaris sp.]
MAEFIWFYGASGAGKASIINKIADGEFDLPGVRLAVVCRESLEFGRRQRIDLLERELGKYAVSSDAVLIKGQGVDLGKLRLPYRIHEAYPDLRQQVVFVYAKPDLLPQRIEFRRDNYWPSPKHDFIKETESQIANVAKLCDDLAIKPLLIDNSGKRPQIKTSHDLAGFYQEAKAS